MQLILKIDNCFQSFAFLASFIGFSSMSFHRRVLPLLFTLPASVEKSHCQKTDTTAVLSGCFVFVAIRAFPYIQAPGLCEWEDVTNLLSLNVSHLETCSKTCWWVLWCKGCQMSRAYSVLKEILSMLFILWEQFYLRKRELMIKCCIFLFISL